MSRKRWERTPTYNSWRAMKDRCNQSSHDSFQYYGQRQITYTPEWESYEGFVRDMGVKPLGMSLDRIDSDKGYGPDNCRWANITEQNRNRRNNVHVTYGNQTKVLSEWAEVTGIPYSTLHARIVHLGWTAEQALTKPIQQQVELKLTYDGRTMSTADWSRETGIPNRTIRTRIKMFGWSVDAALTTPVSTE